MPQTADMEWIELTDFSPGIHSSLNLAGGLNVTSDNPCLAQKADTFRCQSLPTGGLGPLPRRHASYALTTPPTADPSTLTYQVAGFATWGRVQPTPSSDIGVEELEAHVVLAWPEDGGGGTFDLTLIWLRERLFDVARGTEIIRTDTTAGAAATSDARYAYFNKTRLNPTTVTDPGTPVMCCFATTRNSNVNIISHAFPDPATPTVNSTIELGDDTEATVIATTHQGRVVMGWWIPYQHGVNAFVITNENLVWTQVNTNILTTLSDEVTVAPPAVFVPELDQTISELASVSANTLLVVKCLGGGYVVTGDLDDPTIVQLPNIASPETANADNYTPIRGVSTSIGYAYSAGRHGIHLWNGGDSSTLISQQLDGEFAILNRPGQMDRLNDLLFVPNNWVWEMNEGRQGWWRIEDPDDLNISYWASGANGNLMGAERTFTTEIRDGEFMHAYSRDELAYSYSWKSHPLWITRDLRMEVRQGIMALQGHGTVTVTITSELGESDSQTIAVDSDIIRNYRFNLSQDAENLTVQIEASGDTGEGPATAIAPLMHRLFIGYKAAQHLPVAN